MLRMQRIHHSQDARSGAISRRPSLRRRSGAREPSTRRHAAGGREILVPRSFSSTASTLAIPPSSDTATIASSVSVYRFGRRRLEHALGKHRKRLQGRIHEVSLLARRPQAPGLVPFAFPLHLVPSHPHLRTPEFAFLGRLAASLPCFFELGGVRGTVALGEPV